MDESVPSPLNQPRLTLQGGTRLTKPLPLGQPFVIGSSRDAHFRIPHPSVALQHAVLTWDGQATLMEDVSGGRGVEIGDVLQTKAHLQPNDILVIGGFLFLYEAPSPADIPGKHVQLDTAPQLSVRYQGQSISEVPLRTGLTFGKGSEADVQLLDESLLPIHAVIERGADGYSIVDKGGSGLLLNGRYFERQTLYIGDRLDFGAHYAFVYEGWALRCVPQETGCAVTAQNLRVQSTSRTLIEGAGFSASPGDFVGIIGPSGSGKTTLLRALCGLSPAQSGQVLLNRTDTRQITRQDRYFGYVPQKEIVHLELTGRQALRYAAALRLPARTPWGEIEKLIKQLAQRLDLIEHLDTPSKRLSGGQLKRLSVAVELLSHPPVLLLDEPTSGLDPESETQLMSQLRDLTATGCTVICATHLIENIHLMDRVEIIAASAKDGEAGTSVYRGRARNAREFFGAKEFAQIYARLREKRPSEWRGEFEARTNTPASTPQPPSRPEAPPPRPEHQRRLAGPLLLRRQWDILRSDKKNLLLLAGQPILIGVLLALAASGAGEHSATKLFLACIATFWMACGNAAPEVVRERAIFERERFAGLNPLSYLGAKFAWLWSLSALQALLLFLTLKLCGGLEGSILWQLLTLDGTAFAATGIGLLISAWARNVLQAVLLVPVFTIPQILFSGYVFKLQDWNEHPAPRLLSRAFPGFGAQRICDTSLLWNQPIANYDAMEKAGLVTAYENLSTALYPLRAWITSSAQVSYRLEESRIYSGVARGAPLRVREGEWDAKSPPQLRLGAIYAWTSPALWGGLLLALWGIASAAAALVFLKQRRE